ncbi:MAG TPA: DUF2860 family protein [Desulfomonilia bacterium]|nr:DUF2860 family protein [Desulfomonilia bacterium]
MEKSFDRTHPVFDKTRKEHDLGGSLTYLLKAPFGYDSLTYVVMLAYARTGANISFFDSNLFLTGMGVQYSF